MEHVFKNHSNEDGSTTLWYSSHGYLHKVVRYEPYELGPLSEEEVAALFERDASIFLRGQRVGA